MVVLHLPLSQHPPGASSYFEIVSKPLYPERENPLA